jgi:hypothetical protein
MALVTRMIPARRQASSMASASASEMARGFSAQMAFTPVRPASTIRAISSTIFARGAAEVQTLTISGRSRSSRSW